MFSSKLRSWMEAVRPRKKQHRKEKQTKANINTTTNPVTPSRWQKYANCRSSQDDLSAGEKENARKITKGGLTESGQSNSQAPSRYSANNLSSPESAYSTGYSTDGTSPGAPPDCYINIRTGNQQLFKTQQQQQQQQGVVEIKYFPADTIKKGCLQQTHVRGTCIPTSPILLTSQVPKMQPQEVDRVSTPQPRNPLQFQSSGATTRLNEAVASPVLTSPRQRNRIRTNPWVPDSALSPGQIRQELPKLASQASVTDSPVSRRFFSPSNMRSQSTHNQSLSSSSCSSLSGVSIHWEPRKQCSGSDEDDCTLNEMMGKYDESYVYEKENDILSESDLTDCDTDIDTGQDGGDEDDPLEREFDFIDHGSYLELEPNDERNTGHCTYYNFEAQRRVSRRRTTRKSKQSSEKRRRSSSNKKRHKQLNERSTITPINGSKSAGATPLSVRRSNHHLTFKLAGDCLKKRSNSISFSRDPLSLIDKRDKEADRKYKELIIEAEHILRSMKTNGLSPRRVPGPTNKRVEMLRNTECSKPELFMKNRLIDEIIPQFAKIPSTNFNGPRFSPKRNHITNFMINNSPASMRREVELPLSPLTKKSEHIRNSIRNDSNRRSPKYRKKINKVKLQECSSTDSDTEKIRKIPEKSECPQSEPVRRKVYLGRGKTVAFNLNYENICNNNSPPYSPTRLDAKENLRQQVLINTIANLKKSLEDQSASLKQDTVQTRHHVGRKTPR